MAGNTVSTLNALMREKFRPKVTQSFHNEPNLLMMFDKLEGEKINDRDMKIPVRLTPSASFIGGSENQLLPGAIAGSYGNWIATTKMVYSSGEFSNLALLQQDVDTVDAGSFKNLAGMLAQAVKDERGDFSRKLSQVCYSDGNGKVSDAIASSTGTTFTVTASTANDTVDKIPVGARLNFYTSSGVIHDNTDAISIVASLVESTGVVTVDATPSDIANGDFPVWEGSWGLMPNGLRGLVIDDSVTLQNLALGTYPGLKAAVLDASGASLGIAQIDRMITRTKKRTGVKRPVDDFVILTHPKQVDAYRNAGYALNTVNATSNRASQKLDLRFNSVSIGGMKVYEDNDCGERELFGLRMSSFKRYSLFEPNLIPFGSGADSWLVPKPGSGAYYLTHQYAFGFVGNLFCEAPQDNFRIYNLAKANLG